MRYKDSVSHGHRDKQIAKLDSAKVVLGVLDMQGWQYTKSSNSLDCSVREQSHQ